MKDFKTLRTFNFHKKSKRLFMYDGKCIKRLGIIEYMVKTGVDFGRNCQKIPIKVKWFRKKEGIASGRCNQKNNIRIPMF